MSSLKPSTIVTGFLFSYVSANLFEFEPQRRNRIASCSEAFTAKVVLLSSKLSRNRNGTFPFMKPITEATECFGGIAIQMSLVAL